MNKFGETWRNRRFTVFNVIWIDLKVNTFYFKYSFCTLLLVYQYPLIFHIYTNLTLEYTLLSGNKMLHKTPITLIQDIIMIGIWALIHCPFLQKLTLTSNRAPSFVHLPHIKYQEFGISKLRQFKTPYCLPFNLLLLY